jgi:ABC-2 type transport system permease protein
LALCVLSTSLVALSIATGFERSSGVLRRLHVTPLGQRRLIGAKISGVIVTEVIQVVALAIVALLIKWRPDGGSVGALDVALALLLGSAGCAGIGLALAGRLRAEVNLAASNGLYLVLLLLSGIVVPLTSLPSAIRRVATARAPWPSRCIESSVTVSRPPEATGSRSRCGRWPRHSSRRERFVLTRRP